MDPVALKILLFLAVIAVSFGGGYAIANWLRLRDMTFRLCTVLFVTGLALSPFLNTVLLQGRPITDTLSFGIDLAGGTNLVYELSGDPKNDDTVSKMVGAIRRRIDPTGTQELAIRQVGKNQIEIIIPKASREEVDAIKDMVTSVGSLEFCVLADRRNQAHQALITRAKDVKDDVRQNKVVVAGWREVAPVTRPGPDGKPMEVPNTEIESDPNLEFRQIKGKDAGFKEVLCVFEPEEKRRVTGIYLSRSSTDRDQMGNPCVSFTLNNVGGVKFGDLTTKYSPGQDGVGKYHLAVLLDDKVQTAPVINEPIHSNGQISGDFTEAEVERIVNILNAGALDVPLNKDPISEFTISPLLGVDVQRKGFIALGAAAIGVFIFLGVYYLWLGLIADICLLLNLILLMGCMAFIDATFTLPGLAGIVLSMGMSVDANVLINERMREELERGSSLRMAIQNGFGKAFSAIFDGNVTALLTSVILYLIGTDQVKGFAVTLFIGLAISMYTALSVNRLMIDAIERKRWLTQFKMRSMFSVTPNFDFISKQRVCAIASLVLIGAGLITFFLRGDKNYDIDFSGGTMVALRFVEPHTAAEVESKLVEPFEGDVSLEELTSADPERNGKMFRVRTTNQNQNEVVSLVNQTFGDELVKVYVTPGKVTSIADDKPLVLDPEAKDKDKEEKKDEPVVEENPFAGGHEIALTFSSPTRLDTAARSIRNEVTKLKTYGSDDSRIKSLIEVEGLDKVESADAESKLTAEYTSVKVKARPDMAVEDLNTAVASMVETHKSTPLLDEINNFEGQVAKEAKWAAIYALIASFLMIIGYVWFQFENLYLGIAAVIALVHDVLATLSMVCLASLISGTPIAPLLLITDFKINLTMIAAFLTIVGYSINDTIVIFDRLREIRGKNPAFTREMVNASLNQTLSRTLLTAGLVFVTVVILYVLGGEGIHGFAYAMVVGTIFGCYSTVFIASPLALILTTWDAKRNNLPVINRSPVAAKVK